MLSIENLKLDNCPRISAKDYTKLRELRDLLMELRYAKEEGYFLGLIYLDTAYGISPIVEKLPYGLQEKWISHGSRYKEENGGCFPPFGFFAKFICDEARMRLSTIHIMDKEVYRDETHRWVAPLPFRVPRQRLPNNRQQALNRLASLQRTLGRKPQMREQFITFMVRIFENGHAEQAPPLTDDEECWYLPTFGVYHPQKPGQIRVVFDSSAQYSGGSLNDVLLTSPDLNNSLLGVLIRIRREQDVIDYRMRVHVFGNSPSPAVAIYRLRRAVREGEQEYGADTVQFVESHFYVDDGLLSLATEAEAINLLQRIQAFLSDSNRRLHKFVSNCQAVMDAFPPEDYVAEDGDTR
eukprot:superscaffoldBa00006246_g21299